MLNLIEGQLVPEVLARLS